MDKVGIRTIVVNFDDEQLPYLSLVQGDAKTRGFDIVICDSDGKEIAPSDDYIVELVATGSNAPDTPYANRHTIKDGKYRVMIPTEALSESGFVFLQLVFYQKSTGAVIHTIEQKCPVYRSRGQEVVESNNLYVDITALRLALEDEETRKSNEIKRETNEATRKSNEIKREENETRRLSSESQILSAEKQRVSNERQRNENEAKRITAEKERETNESQRQKDEKSRLENETQRTQNENTRKDNENKRLSSEAERQSNETTRKSQETARQSAEDKRLSAETIRDDNEEIRNSNEVKREENEGIRIAQEKDRVIAEEERKAKFDGWDKTMEGIIPNATDISTGVVKVDKTEGEEAPHTVPTIGTFDSAIAVLKGDVVGKQDKLTAGDNIDIIGDTISAVDTITTINGKTGAISKDDITALGIPSQDTVYKKPSSEPISYIQGLQAELDSKVASYGTNPVLNIAVISAGDSTTGIPNNTLILELE